MDNWEIYLILKRALQYGVKKDENVKDEIKDENVKDEIKNNNYKGISKSKNNEIENNENNKDKNNENEKVLSPLFDKNLINIVLIFVTRCSYYKTDGKVIIDDQSFLNMNKYNMLKLVIPQEKLGEYFDCENCLVQQEKAAKNSAAKNVDSNNVIAKNLSSTDLSSSSGSSSSSGLSSSSGSSSSSIESNLCSFTIKNGFFKCNVCKINTKLLDECNSFIYCGTIQNTTQCGFCFQFHCSFHFIKCLQKKKSSQEKNMKSVNNWPLH